MCAPVCAVLVYVVLSQRASASLSVSACARAQGSGRRGAAGARSFTPLPPLRRAGAIASPGDWPTPAPASAVDWAGGGGASRCLHVGNVAAALSEADLEREFGCFGPLERVKIVAGKDRRFAFVNFVALPDAARAKAALSAAPMWRHNIFFARRDGAAAAAAGGDDPAAPTAAGGVAARVPAGAGAAAPAGVVRWWQRPRNLAPSRHLWMGGLRNTSAAVVRAACAAHGRVGDVSFLPDRHCAFVEFADVAGAIAAYRGLQVWGRCGRPPLVSGRVYVDVLSCVCVCVCVCLCVLVCGCVCSCVCAPIHPPNAFLNGAGRGDRRRRR